MTDKTLTSEDKIIVRRYIDAAIKVGAIAILATWCYDILKPFVTPIIWAAILAVALHPLCLKLSKSLGGKKSLASGLIAVIAIAIMVIPTWQFSSSAIERGTNLSQQIKEGTLVVPPPTEQVKEWPLIGEKTHVLWSEASNNLTEFLTKHSEQIKEYSGKVLSGIAGFGATIGQFIISFIIAAVFMTKSESCHQGVKAFFRRLMNEKGEEAVTNSIATIRSVAQGVLGIAAIQAFLAAIGLIVADIPLTGLWTLLVLIVAIMQLPPILILGPVSAYYFSVADPTPAVIFLVYSLIVSSADAFLKPLLLGRGTDVPMLVILLGAIGGMVSAGIIGLFIGAVILALAYQLMMDWLAQTPNIAAEKSTDV
ncbi:AI-2E family transporter [Thalassotalea euphylliae]|uniref:AI-2E family transporter n=1 Tax=Thalassotalea euphylliae TaxID=1655234 RepID=UPI003643BDB8